MSVLAHTALGQQQTITPGEGCPSPTTDAVALSPYQVHAVSLDLPFDFLNVQRNQLLHLEPPLLQKRDSPFKDGDVTKDVQRITDVLFESSLGVGLPLNVTAVVAFIENCRSSQSPKSLDVVYRAFTSRIPFFSVRTAESVAIESADPVKGAGLDRELRFSLVPSLDYDRASKAQVGVAMVVRNQGPIEALTLNSRGSTDSRLADGALNGSWSPGGLWFSRLDWRAGYLYSDQPTENGRLKKNLGSGQLSALLHDFGSAGPMLRAGASYEQGVLGSRFLPSKLPAGTLARADYAGIKLFSGLSWRGQSQTFNVSYGLQFGSAGDGFSHGFRKHIGDVVYQVRLLPKDHTPHEFDVRFSVGAIQNLGSLPVTERFFGGNNPTDFIAGETWRLNASPIIRSFAQNELARAGAFHAGGENFVSFNFSYAPVVWKRPLLPPELIANPEFNQKVEGLLNTAGETLRQAYFGRDPAVEQIAGMTDAHDSLEEAVNSILAVFNSAEDTPKGDQEDRYLECRDEAQNIVDNEDIRKMSDSNRGNAGVQINAMLRPKGRLEELRRCAADLRSLLGPDIDPALTALAVPENALRAIFARFQPERANERAVSDLKFTRRVLNRFFHEINLASIAPVMLFDAARIGAVTPGESAFRYGIGGGVRFSLASTARFTLAYTANPDRRPGERSGAWVLSFDVVDLFY